MFRNERYFDKNDRKSNYYGELDSLRELPEPSNSRKIIRQTKRARKKDKIKESPVRK